MFLHVFKNGKFSLIWYPNTIQVCVCVCVFNVFIHPTINEHRFSSCLGHWKLCCNEHGHRSIFWKRWFHFIQMYIQKWNFCIIKIVYPFLVFEGTSILFSIVAESICIPTKVHKGALSLLILTTLTSCLLFFTFKDF